ncbi:MAG: OsmC family protein [Sphingobacteriales bacterium JAD_PAG50586_3]|nr:MAG: OsmC family protein [Sphingobacteriales bacterium JAD_PAG50586_3]
METMVSVYKGDLRTEDTHLKSGTVIFTDAPPDNQGKGESFSPTDLLCASLASCALTIMGIAARTHSIAMDGTQVRITKLMAADPRRVSGIILEFDMVKNYPEKEQKILEHAARTCPVMLSLAEGLNKDIRFNYPEN